MERERVLLGNWFPVARQEDLALPGDYLSIESAGDPILVTHGLDGELRAFSNVCSHRLTRLAQGCGHARSFQCPYHLWTYDLSGQLIGSPGMEDAEEFRRGDWNLRELGLDTWGEAWTAIGHPPAQKGMEALAVVTVFPTLLFSINRPFSMFWFQLNLLGHDEVELDMQAFLTPELADNEDLAKALVEGVVAVNNEDFAINERTWRGMHSRDATMGPLSRYEEGVKRFRRWLNAELAETAAREQ